jgi:uncharacterized protein YlxP (DUF503 family)
MPAHVGLLTLELSLPGTSSLKEKRSRLRPLLEGLRNRFTVSTSEVGHANLHDRSTVAAAIVSSDVRVIQTVMSEIAAAAEEYDLRVDGVQTEVIC